MTSDALVRRLDDDHAFDATCDGVQADELTPTRPRRFVAAETLVAAFASAPPVDSERFADVDGVVDQDATPPS